MKKLLIVLTLLSSMSAFASVELSQLSLLSMKYDLRTVVENAFGSDIYGLQYNEDGESLQVHFDKRTCYNVNLQELEVAGYKRLVVTKIQRDLRCDNN